MSSIHTSGTNIRRPHDAVGSQSSARRGLRQRIPYRMFGKRLDSTKRLMVSSKVWMRTIPTQNCDIVLTCPAKADDSTLMWLLARLKTRTPQIIVHVRHHSNSGIYGFYMTATYENLLKGAEELGIKKPLKPDYGGGMKEFTFEDQDCFAGVEEEEHFLSSQERQSILFHLLCELRAVEGEQLGNIRFIHGQPIIPRLESGKVISQVFPLHNKDALQELRKSWVQAVFRKQPLQQIVEYFGVKIALYFAYLGHYTASLCLPALLGVIFWFLQDTQEMEDLCFVIFALFNVLWATLYLEHWKRASSQLAYKWGTLDKKDELIKDPRPLYTGDLVKSPVTGQMQPYYPPWKRSLFRYLVSFPVIGVCLFLVFAVMLLIFELQEWVNTLIAADDIPAFLRFFPKILLALSIFILDEGYRIIALWLNNMENYRLEETYENQLIIKLVLFQFVNSFLSLFYIAFYIQDMDRLREQLAALLITRQVIGNLKEALLPYLVWKVRLLKVGLTITGQMSPSSLDKEIKEMTNSVRRRCRSGERRDDMAHRGDTGETDGVDDPGGTEEGGGTDQRETTPSPEVANNILTKDKLEDPVIETDIGFPGADKHSGPTLTQVEVESAMKKYEDTYEDYLEMFIQFGYVTLFSSAFPLAALCGLLNNVIEVRSDAFKLCVNHQRPFGKQVENIGIWQDALEVMGVIAVIVNCALIGMAGIPKRLIPDISMVTTIIGIIVLEHIILVLKFYLAYAIPDVPEWVAHEMAKVEFQRREALKRLEAQTGSHHSPDYRRRCTSEGTPTSPRSQARPPDSPIVRKPIQVPKTLQGVRSATQSLPQPPPRAVHNQRATSLPPNAPIYRNSEPRGPPSTDPWSQGEGRPDSRRTVPRSQSSSAILMSSSPDGNRGRNVPKSVPRPVPVIPESSNRNVRDGDGTSVDAAERSLYRSSNKQESTSNSQCQTSYRSEQVMNAENSHSLPRRRTSDSNIYSQSPSQSEYKPRGSSRSEPRDSIPEGASYLSDRNFMCSPPSGGVVQRRPPCSRSESDSSTHSVNS